MSRPRGSKNKKDLELSSDYNLTFKSLGRTFKAEGETIEAALSKIKISGGARATGVLKVEKGGKTRERILSGRTSGHLFGEGSPTAKEIHLKKVLMLFDI